MFRTRTPLRMTALALALGTASCDGARTNDPSIEGQPNELIGGFAADSRALDAVGAMVAYAPQLGGSPIEICSAALIDAKTVLTAKHCVEIIPYAVSSGYRIAFAIGPDVLNPRAIVDVIAHQAAPGDAGGFVGRGRDVAVLHLAQPVADLTPIDVAELSDGDVGLPFAAIGYGVRDNSGASGKRRLGKQTLRARQGRVFEVMFGSFEAFYEWFRNGNAPRAAEIAAGKGVSASDAVKQAFALAPVDGGGGPVVDGGAGGSGGGSGPDGGVGGSGGGGGPIDGGAGTGGSTDGGPIDWLEQYARMIYDQTVLLPGYEVVTGGAPGDSQPCYGDSGGPLIKWRGDRFVSFGVVSGGIGSNESICDLGTVYAAFGPDVLSFIDEAKRWVDPCEGVSTAGTCVANHAVRCTEANEGRRRLVDFDCAALGLTCNTDGSQVSCGDVPVAPAPVMSQPQPEVGPELQRRVNDAFASGMRGR